MKNKYKTPPVLSAPKREIWKLQLWIDLHHISFFPMILVVLVLSVTVNYYVGDLALDLLSWSRWKGIGSIVFAFVLGLFFLDIIASFFELGNFRNQESGQIDVSALWRKVFTNPLSGLLLIAVMTFGITSAQDLSEYYRVNITTWHDVKLWTFEVSFLDMLKGSLIDTPKFWDVIYFSYWLYLILVFSVLYRTQKMDDFSILTIATVFSYFFTRWVALQYPVAGPAFYQPGYFELTGTVSKYVQESLVLYMRGEIPQNGFIPGTMGMPSLHVGITTMAAYYLARNVKWAMWPSVIWTCMIWLSTIMLGWHYIIDGVGGILIAMLAVLASSIVLSTYRNLTN